MIAAKPNHPPVRGPATEARMLHPFLRTLVKIALASLLVGTILAHFGITAEALVRATGLSAEQIEDYARRGLAWAWPNVMLGAMIIVPVWFVIYLLRPPGASRHE